MLSIKDSSFPAVGASLPKGPSLGVWVFLSLFKTSRGASGRCSYSLMKDGSVHDWKMPDTSEDPVDGQGGTLIQFSLPSSALSLADFSFLNSPTPNSTAHREGQHSEVASSKSLDWLHTAGGLPSGLTPIHQDDKGLHSFLSFHLPSPLPIFSVFPACDLPRSGRVVDGCISGPRGEMKEAKIRYPPASSSWEMFMECLLPAEPDTETLGFDLI